MEKRDLYAEVTNKIVAALEQGVAPWVKPWKNGGAPAGGALPYNYLTGRAYRGVNVPLLWSSDYESNAWMTFKQAQSLSTEERRVHVRKGERGSMIVFYKPIKIYDTVDGKKVERKIPLLRAFTVFNVAQIEGLPEGVAPAPVASNFPGAEAALAQARVVHGGDVAAYYGGSADYIRMPHKAQFRSEQHYYAVGLHELTHWTGHAKRCNREFGKKFGDQAYAREELVAEMGAAFLCAQFGIEGQLQHAEYLQSWINCLKADKRAIIAAASAAQKAVDFVNQAATAEAEDDDECEMACAA